VLDSIYDTVRAEFSARGCYLLSQEEIEALRPVLLVNGSINAKIVGQSAATIAALAGITVPKDTKILIGEVTSVEPSEPFAHEKLSPVLAMYRADTFDAACAMAQRLLEDGGFGHTAAVYLSTRTAKEKLDRFSQRMKACRILVNTPSAQGGIGDLYNFRLTPSLTLGCGSWGGNSVSENVGVRHLLNVKTVARRRENMLWFRSPDKVYFKKGCLPVAMAELQGKKKAFIVTDSFLFQNGYTKSVEAELDAMGITHTVFSNVSPDPTLSCAREGAEAMAAFRPDLIIAVGGGSAMDAAKIMWVLYEHPDADF
jgi:acetaldehyde dehydrogenase/alcohol dehydrogenase